MNPAYKEAREVSERLLSRCESAIDDREHDMSEKLTNAARDVRETIESNRPPRSIEDQIKRVQQHLQKLKAEPTPAMSPNDAGSLFNDYEDLRRRVRSLPNY